MKQLALFVSSILFTACTVHTINIEHSQLNDARTAIATSKAANAEQCAPKLQAQAVAALYGAAHEVAEGGHLDEEVALAEEAVAKAHAAIAKCQPPVVKEVVARVPVVNIPIIPAPIPSVPVIAAMVEIITLDGVNFHTNSSLLTTASIAILNHAVATLKKRADINVEVAAHTDSHASEKYNLWLSNRRADSVMKFLMSHGIDATRLSFHGYGESQPIASNTSKEGRAINRRVELRVIQ